MRRSLGFGAMILLTGCMATGPARRDTHEQLQGTLWMQTAAEYRMLTETTYRQAGEALQKALTDPAWTAATEQTEDASQLPPAVILDLDETVIDNSRFQGEQVVRRAPYTPELWTAWVKAQPKAENEPALIPGARDFLKDAKERGVTVFFISNRTPDEEAFTLETLEKLDVQTIADEVLLNQENGWTSDKTARRTFVADHYRVLLLIGDDLGDFIPSKLPPEERVKAAEQHRAWWGTRWFLLPNPMYGSWDRALYTAKDDSGVLEQKRAKVHGFQN
jgi:5'-nucleotidase (lipoprotein e(P4) family)